MRKYSREKNLGNCTLSFIINLSIFIVLITDKDICISININIKKEHRNMKKYLYNFDEYFP